MSYMQWPQADKDQFLLDIVDRVWTHQTAADNGNVNIQDRVTGTDMAANTARARIMGVTYGRWLKTAPDGTSVECPSTDPGARPAQLLDEMHGQYLVNLIRGGDAATQAQLVTESSAAAAHAGNPTATAADIAAQLHASLGPALAADVLHALGAALGKS